MIRGARPMIARLPACIRTGPGQAFPDRGIALSKIAPWTRIRADWLHPGFFSIRFVLSYVFQHAGESQMTVRDAMGFGRAGMFDGRKSEVDTMRHTISVLVENKFGVLSRIAGLFSGRGFNIDSLTVGPTHDKSLSRMTIVTRGADSVLEQVDKQLNKLVDVLKVTDLTGSGFVSRELMLIKVKTTPETRSEVMQITDIFKADVVHVDHAVLVIQVTGPTEKVDAFIDLMDKFGIVELARTGCVALGRCPEPTETLDMVAVKPRPVPRPVDECPV